MPVLSDWQKVSEESPCTVCGKPDWCTFTNTIACCMRIQGKKRARNGGWFFPLGTSPVERKTSHHVCKVRLDAITPDYWSRFDRYTSHDDMREWSRHLGLQSDTLRRFGLCQYRHRLAMIPMRLPDETTCGVQIRRWNGEKRCVKRSKLGLFTPIPRPSGRISGWLIVCEGMTDAAAMTDAGFEAVGRTSCASSVEQLAVIVSRRDVVILGDNDEPGIRGAEQLAAALRRRARRVRVAFPPDAKDAREWTRDCSALELMHVMENAL